MRQFQHLHKQTVQFREEASPEGGQGVAIRVTASGNESKSHRIVGGPFDLAAGEHPGGVAIDQQRKQRKQHYHTLAQNGETQQAGEGGAGIRPQPKAGQQAGPG